MGTISNSTKAFALPLLSFVVLNLYASLVRGQSNWTLEQSITYALEHNLTVENRALDIVAASSEQERALGMFLPNLNGYASHGYNWGRRIDPFTNTFATDRVRANNFYLSSDVDLFKGFQNQLTLQQAKLDREVSEMALEAAKTQVRTDVTDLYLIVLSRKEQLRIAEIQVIQTQERLENLEQRVSAGVVPSGDLFDLRAQLAQEDFNVTEMENQRDQNLLALMQLLQLPAEQRPGFSIASPSAEGLSMDLPNVPLEQVIEQVRAQYPAYQRSLLAAESAAKGVDIARTGAMPALSLSGSLGTGYSGLNSEVFGEPSIGDPQVIGYTASGEEVLVPNVIFDTRTKSFGDQLNDNLNESLTLSLTIPIFNKFQNKVNVAQARIREQQAQNQVRLVNDQLATLVQSALTTQRGAHKQFLSAQRAHEASEEAFRYAEERYTQKSITSLELNTSKSNRDKAAAQMVDAKYAYLFASKYLDILQGQPVGM